MDNDRPIPVTSLSLSPAVDRRRSTHVDPWLYPNLLSWCRRFGGARAGHSDEHCVLGGCGVDLRAGDREAINLAFPGICAKGRLLKATARSRFCCHRAWSAVVLLGSIGGRGVDADGAPDGDFTKEGGSRVAAGCRSGGSWLSLAPSRI